MLFTNPNVFTHSAACGPHKSTLVLECNRLKRMCRNIVCINRNRLLSIERPGMRRPSPRVVFVIHKMIADLHRDIDIMMMQRKQENHAEDIECVMDDQAMHWVCGPK